jgi:hypothetical protein
MMGGAVRPLALDAFMPVTLGSAVLPRIAGQLRHYGRDTVLFRLVRTS